MSLSKTAIFTLKKHRVLFTAVRNHWNKDYKPREFPSTEDQRQAAARKYGLNPFEYQTYPNDGSGFGDYPKIPLESGDSKDNYYPWDNPEHKRNFGESIHVEADLIGEDRYDVSAKHRISFKSQWGQFLLVVFGTMAIYIYMEDMKMFPAILPKQYPESGKIHYTFESKE